MARPRKNTTNPSATELIENAFWKILKNEGYQKITIIRIKLETGLNRNSIYYHYDNVEDIARNAINNLTNNKTVIKFLSSMLSGKIDESISPEIVVPLKKIRLLAKSNSFFLQSCVKEILLDVWINHFQICKEELNPSDTLCLNFIASGITSYTRAIRKMNYSSPY